MISLKRIVALTLGLAAGLTALAGAAQAQQINGAGGTFPAPIYNKWFQEYGQAHGLQINYAAIGSGGGIKAITGHTVDFGASDAPMTDAQLAAAPGILHIPTVAGAVVLGYNIPGVSNGVRFTPQVIAGIFSGRITRWNDPEITRINPGTTFPDLGILPCHRSDGSGTTNIFTTYLSDVDGDWATNIGHGTAVRWPVGLGGKGNAGVAQLIKNNSGGIGYIELAYAVTNNIPYGPVRNRSGKYIYPDVHDTSLAVSGVNMPADFRKVAVNTSNPAGYPITGFTFILLYRNGTKPDVKQLFQWCLTDGQGEVESLSYAPLPENIRSRALALLATVR
jgi:phosphate transport system substrate-binding protein